MLKEINEIASAMQRQVIKRGNFYYVCNESGEIRLTEHTNIKGVLAKLGSTLQCCDVLFAISDDFDEPDWRDADSPCCPECGSDWGGTL